MTFSKISFFCRGHPNLLGAHRNTIEFTKDKELTLKGDCIVGVDADFSFDLLKPVLGWKRFRMTIKAGGLVDELEAEVNPGFSSEHEVVIRKTGFLSERTLGINANKAAKDIDRKLINALSSPIGCEVIIEPL
ncbi:MAG: DUF371 domain-containing protein [Candidatus Woesearchaeota archaeon]